MTAVACQLAIPNADHLGDQIRTNAARVTTPADVVQHGSGQGKTLTIAGAGATLAETWRSTRNTDHVWACNSALPYLLDMGALVTHGFCVDQGREMLGPREWPRAFPVEYLLASTVHPDLAAMLADGGRRVRWFHNYCGLAAPDGWVPPEGYEAQGYEFWLYATLYPPAPQVGYGLNSGVRALCLALWMGYDHITILGADSAARANGPAMPVYGTAGWVDWLRATVLYADGRTAFDAYGSEISMLETEIDGVRWHTRPDMAISAQHLANLAMAHPDRVTLVGQTLAGAMLGKPRAWFDTCPQLSLTDGVTNLTLKAAA